MAYLKISRARFEFLLRFGVGDDELRRFFSEKRIPLILKGGKVQNLPRGYEARIHAVVSLPPATDPILQNWFSTNLTMLDPVSSDELVETFRIYEEVEESLPVGDAKRLSRSCLIHLFSVNPPQGLVDFLRFRIGGSGTEPEPQSDKGSLPKAPPPVTDSSLLSTGLAFALVALVEGKDPDEFASELPPAIASFVTGLHAVKEGRTDEVQIALEELEKQEGPRVVLTDFAARYAKSNESSKPAISGIQIINFENSEKPEFDSDKDEIIGICTKDSPENSVFVHPFAIRTRNGKFLSLLNQGQREAIFPISGDVMAFQGHVHPRQPKRNEIGIWHVSQNPGPAIHHTNYHLAGAKNNVYEVRSVPFKSNEYDSVREFIKEQIVREGKNQLIPLLFLLRDDLIVGCPSGKDLSKDEGFEQGIPCWTTISAFRFEGRLIVPGPLPASEQYECEKLASGLKKFLSSKKSDSEKFTKAQLKYLQDILNSGEAHLNAARHSRLLEELNFIESHVGAVDLLVEEVMTHEVITARIDKLVQDKVKEQTEKKSELTIEIAQSEKRLAELKIKFSKQQKEQRALPSAISKAIKDSVDKAKNDALDTLGQVLVFKTLMDELSTNQYAGHSFGCKPSPLNFRLAEPAASPLLNTLKALGVPLKHAKALEVVGDIASATGLFLVIEGIASRLAAEAWAGTNANGSVIMECGIGVTEDTTISEIATDETQSIAILDANLSPIDVYARPLIDQVQRRILTSPEARKTPRILMTLSASLAGLPLPRNVEALAVRVSLESNVKFLREEDAQARLDDMESEDIHEGWASLLWKPAFKAVAAHLKRLPPEEAALAISVLDAEDI